MSAHERDIDAAAVERALDAACAVIQQRLGQTAGDFAGVYFSDAAHPVRAGLLEYLRAERADMQQCNNQE